MLSRNPNDTAVLLICAHAHLELGDTQQALSQLQRLLNLDAENDRAWHLLGMALRAKGDGQQARHAFERVNKSSSWYLKSQLQVAGLHHAEQDYENTYSILQTLCQLYPGDAQPVHALASMKASELALEEAIVLADRAFNLDPSFTVSLFLAADCARLLGHRQQCREYVQKILAMAPDHPVARLLDTTSLLPHIYQSADEIDGVRSHFAHSLERLKAAVSKHPPAKALCRSFSQSLYYLAYQGRNDRDLLMQYGGIVGPLHENAYPQWSQPLPMPPAADRIRVGFVSAFFNLHSNCSSPI